ncbi:heparinase II/III domain-containing protein [Bradyrhizobium sp. 2TAF24]|uniref:heparinase II/III domain-containing protein n=1 Tax=Bradyrhizobium sp. 2TAF24 TaxID=3233011 RepID=UPI003F93775A
MPRKPSRPRPARGDLRQMQNLTHKLGWYVNRLRAMNAREIRHRLGEAAKRRIAARRSFHWDDFTPRSSRLPALAVDRGHLALLSGDLRQAWRAVAPSSDGPGIYQALGHAFTVSKGIDWHRDPTSGLRWPDQAYCFDIAYRHDRARGDVKLVWELNRLQFVPVIAALAVMDGDEQLAQTALDLIESWIDANPPFKGINWVSGIELALRVVSVLLTIGLLGEARVGERLARKIGACLAAHAYWLARYPSKHSSANNHLIAEAGALFILGTLWPDAGLEAAAGEARETLIAEAFLQIHDDGVGAEQSPTYTAFTCEWYLLALSVAARAGHPFPADVVTRIASAGACLGWITDGGGHQPRIGDDDEGRVISSGAGHEAFYVASVVNAMAAIAGRDDLAMTFGGAQLRNVVLGWRAAAPAPEGMRSFAEGGYTVSRRRLAGRVALVVMDHGPLGYLSIAAHGHADALSLLLHLDGQPVLVDAGTYLYHAGGAVRDRLRGTAAHNTLCLDGADQSQIAGAFNWRHAAKAQLIVSEEQASGHRVVARHDGYVREYGLICERTLHIDTDHLTVTDELLPAGHGGSAPVRGVRSGFLLHPDLSAVVNGSAVLVSRAGVPLLSFTAADHMTCRLEAAEYSPAFGVMTAATRIVIEASEGHARRFEVRITVLPQETAARIEPATVRLQPDQGTAVAMSDGARELRQ